MFCQDCGNNIQEGSLFCDKCGKKLPTDATEGIEQASNTPECPSCHNPIEANTKFCPGCGTNLTQIRKCSKCGNFLAPTSLFCRKCGEAVPKICPKCSRVLEKEAKFCPNCGCSTLGSRTQTTGAVSSPSVSQTAGGPHNDTGKLCRIREGKILAGVCTGLQAKFNLNAWLFRLLFIFSGIGLIVYIIMAVALKYSEEVAAESLESSQSGSVNEFINNFSANFYRIKEGKILAGVCTGLADKYKQNARIFRAIALFTGIGCPVYILLALLLKYKDAPAENAALDEIWEKSGKNRSVAIILSLFLGFFAVDRFYLGDIRKGLLKLIWSWGGFLVGFILLIIKQNSPIPIVVSVLSIISMLVLYIADIVRLAIGKLLPTTSLPKKSVPVNLS